MHLPAGGASSLQCRKGSVGRCPMAYRPLSRAQTWLLPPTLEELIPTDHSARFVAAFVDALSRADWQALGVGPDGELLGATAYPPWALLGVWLFGYMSGVG